MLGYIKYNLTLCEKVAASITWGFKRNINLHATYSRINECATILKIDVAYQLGKMGQIHFISFVQDNLPAMDGMNKLVTDIRK